MDDSLAAQTAAFKSRMLAQPVIKKKIVVPLLYSQQAIPLSRLLFDVVGVLKAEGRPMTPLEIIRKAAIDIESNAELQESLARNERITFEDGKYEFKPRFKIRTKEDLLTLLARNRGISGMEVKELKASYEKVVDLIEELELTGSILVIRNAKDNSPRTVYYNDVSLNLKISPEFKDIWNGVKVPLDLEKEMIKLGLGTMKVDRIRVVKKVGEKKAKKRRGRFKLTNTHLVGVDLTKEYINPNPEG